MASTGTDEYVHDYIPYFDDLIRTTQAAVVSFRRSVGVCIVLGAAIILVSVILLARGTSWISPILSLAGGFISASLVFPYKEIEPRRARIETYLLLRRRLCKLGELSEEDRKRLIELAEDAIKKRL